MPLVRIWSPVSDGRSGLRDCDVHNRKIPNLQATQSGLHIALAFGPQAKGPSRLAHHLLPSQARALAALDHGVHLIRAGRGEPGHADFDEEIRAGLTVRSIGITEGMRDGALGALCAKAIGKAQLVHYYASSQDSAGLLPILAKKQTLVLTVMDVPDVETQAQAQGWQSDLEAAHLVIVPSRTLLVRMADILRLDPARTKIQELGLSHGMANVDSASRAWQGEGPLRILHLGARSACSGIEDLVDALEPLPVGSVQLCCFGEPGEPLEAGLKTRHPVLISPGGQLAGSRNVQSLAHLASTCHLAAFPSRLGSGYPVAIEEALALGLPVVASECEAAEERYGQGPIESLPAGDVVAWTRTIQRYLADPSELQRAQAAVPETIASVHSVAKDLESLYRHVLHSRVS